MVRLREIPRTATFAWSVGPQNPLVATGTRAGAVDADFSDETKLELWDLALDNEGQSKELQPVGSVETDSRFHDIAWSQPTEDHTRGIIAGALESGALDLWNAEKLRSGADSHISRAEKHTGAIKSLQFNPFRNELLATAGAKGELYITDWNNATNPFRLGASTARADDFETLDWNKKVPHILATGSSGGFVTVWDVKAKKESLNLNNHGRKAVSAVAWDPDTPTRLATAIPNDQDPLILVWDLRNSNAPAQTLRLHDQGVLSLSWCLQDGNLLLSCGKDNRTVCWNPHTGQALGEFPVVTNWTFQTRFNPHNPSLLATASFDGKIAVQTIQNTNPTSEPAAAAQALDGEDFFAKAQSQPQGATFSLPQAPKWLKRPVSVSFGFGGKLVKTSLDEATKTSKISISTFAVDSSIGDATGKFEEALGKGDLASICESKKADARTEEEKADWTVIETLISSNPRQALLDYLGVAPDQAGTEADGAVQTNGTAAKDEGSFFDNTGDDSFLSTLASTKGARTNNPFHIFTGSESDADKNITRALMLGSFEKAMDLCLKEDRLADAFMIAVCGGQKCIDQVQTAFFKKRSDGPSYLRLLASVVGKNLWDVVYNADLSNWKEVMAALCTFADTSEFADLCEALGDRLEEMVQDGKNAETARKDASFCYLAGSKLEKVVGNWAQELEENEKAGATNADQTESSFSIHARSLQDFIEKVTIFRQVTDFKDQDLQKTGDWKLAPLYAKYTEYADVVAAHGQLNIAEKYLDLLPAQYPAAEVARNRVKQATRRQAPAVVQKPAAPTATPQRGQRVAPAWQAASPAPTQPTGSQNPYAPPGVASTPQPAPSQYTPANANPYAPSGGYQPPQAGYQPPGSAFPQPQPFAQGYGQPQPAPGIAPPPRGSTSSPAVRPPPKGPVEQWNDTPDFGPKPTSRRGTPAQALPNPYQNQQPGMSPYQPTGTPAAFAPPPQQARATPPPPPKGPSGQGPPRMMSPPQSAVSQSSQPERPSSSAASAYAPPPGSQQSQYPGGLPPPMAPPIARGASPYQPPPAGGASSNRYAPTPGAQPSQQQGAGAPPRMGGPPTNPYAPQNYPQSTPIGLPSQPPQQRAPPSQAPPRGPPPGGPLGGPPQAAPGSRPGSTQPPPKAAAKHPAGDRSHISASSQPIYEILNADMQRVKARAPAAFKPQVLDTEKRLNILFDHLNNEDLLKPDTVQELGDLAQAYQAKDFERAAALAQDLLTNKTDEGSNWIVGVQRLIKMSRATPA